MTTGMERELATAELGDRRRTSRAQRIGARWAAAPGASFPVMMVEDAELEGFYGLVENDKVDHRELLAAHARETCKRIEEAALGQEILVVEDTTVFAFGGESIRRDLGWLTYATQGFFAHIALAVSADGHARPFGVIGLSTFERERPEPRATRPERKHDGKATASDPERESLRWGRLADETSELLRGYAKPIHITDREADSYEYLSGRIAKDQRFVLRARELDRPVTVAGDTTKSKLRVVADASVPLTERTAKLASRPRSPFPSERKKNPPRAARDARLEFAAETVRIERPKHLPAAMLASIDINLVHVREIDPPVDAQPVEWLLLTSEPIDTAEQVLRVVDHYRARWTIEELNKAIKTGCQYEARQLESRHALLIALALCIPVAWQMLAVRHQSRTTPDAPAITVVSKLRLDTLRTIARRPLPAAPTVLDVYLAIAGLGGHIRRNGPPGWQTLRKGMEKLLLIEAAFEARDAEKTRSRRSGES